MSRSERIELVHRVLVSCSADRIWQELRDLTRVLSIMFASSNPDAQFSQGTSVDSVPAMVRFTLVWSDGTHIPMENEVIERSDADRFIRYRVCRDTPLLADYVAQLGLLPAPGEPSKAVLEWKRTFRVIDARDTEQVIADSHRLAAGYMNLFEIYFGAKGRSA